MTRTYASERAHQLRNALIEMTIRYGASCQRSGLAYGGERLSMGKPWQHHRRAAARQFRAIQRLSDALRDLEVQG